MRKAGEILKELGFNKDAPLETQKAFFRHLVAKAEIPREVNTSHLSATVSKKSESVTDCSTQLSFDPTILGLIAK